MITSMIIIQFLNGYRVGFTFNGAFFTDDLLFATIPLAQQRAIEIWNLYIDIAIERNT